MFVLAGWLFADLFVGLALLFMVGNTQRVPVALATPTETITPMPTLPPTPTPTPIPPPSIDPHDLIIQLSVNDPYAITNQDPQSIQQLLSDIESQLATNKAQKRRVGIVLIYSGTTDDLANAVAGILPGAGAEFRNAIYRQYFTIGQPYSYLSLDIFFFR